jgi:hypothetical protein
MKSDVMTAARKNKKLEPLKKKIIEEVKKKSFDKETYEKLKSEWETFQNEEK